MVNDFNSNQKTQHFKIMKKGSSNKQKVILQRQRQKLRLQRVKQIKEEKTERSIQYLSQVLTYRITTQQSNLAQQKMFQIKFKPFTFNLTQNQLLRSYRLMNLPLISSVFTQENNWYIQAQQCNSVIILEIILQNFKSQKNFLENIQSCSSHRFQVKGKFSKYFFKYEKSLIDYVTQINWIGLIWLEINDCQLTSIEFISFLNCPNLNYICLDKNKICQIKAFSKLRCGRLRELNFARNPVSQFRTFSRINCLRSKKFEFHFSPFVKSRNFYSMNELSKFQQSVETCIIKEIQQSAPKQKINHTPIINSLKRRFLTDKNQ